MGERQRVVFAGLLMNDLKSLLADARSGNSVGEDAGIVLVTCPDSRKTTARRTGGKH